MIKFDLTLENNLYFELDPARNANCKERELARYGEKIARTLEFSFRKHPEIRSITALKRHYAYYDKCYIHLGEDLENPVSLRDKTVKECILELYMEIAPQYLKTDMDFEDDNIDLLEYFDLTKMPDSQRPQYAFPGLITFEELKKGKLDERNKPSFPGLHIFSLEEKNKFCSNKTEPAYAAVEGYTKIKGESEEEKKKFLMNKLEELKREL